VRAIADAEAPEQPPNRSFDRFAAAVRFEFASPGPSGSGVHPDPAVKEASVIGCRKSSTTQESSLKGVCWDCTFTAMR
jgi:hypothetical protein